MHQIKDLIINRKSKINTHLVEKEKDEYLDLHNLCRIGQFVSLFKIIATLNIYYLFKFL